MTAKLNEIKTRLIQAASITNDNNWWSIKVEINFPPYINKGLRATQIVKDKDAKSLPVAVINFDDVIYNLIYDFVLEFNQSQAFNQIAFFADKNRLDNAEIIVHFVKEVDEEFWSNIPKSKRGKVIPWWKQTDV